MRATLKGEGYKPPPKDRPAWSTSSLGSGTDPSVEDLAELRGEFEKCTQTHGLEFVLRSALDGVGRFARDHIITTLLSFGAVIRLFVEFYR